MKLNYTRIQEIENIALDVITHAYSDKSERVTPPIELNKILKANKIKLKIGDFKDEDILGAYEKSTKTIYVDGTENYVRKAFTVAHELGHFFLHEKKQAEIFYRADILKLEQNELEESEANVFAAALLMPQPLVTRFWEQFKNKRVIAHVFKVSNTAAYYRLKNLKLIE
jgi:Zn-dependent peptidase ImmA (M78 family)